MKMLEIVDAVECEKHECQVVKTSTCEECPSFYGLYQSMAGTDVVTCIYPKELPTESNPKPHEEAE